MVRQSLFLIIIGASLIGCARVPDLDTEASATISVESQQLLASEGLGEVEPSKWPKGIAGLEPEFVFIVRDGLYIATGSFFVSEWGYFVARDVSTFVVPEGEDPTYVKIGKNLFKYRLSG